MLRNVKKIVVASMLVLFFQPSYISVAEKAQLVPIEVNAVIPKNQLDKTVTYFDLLLKPSQKQTLEVELTNSTDEDKIIEVRTNTATTNDNGIVDYSQAEKEKDSTLLHSFSEIATTPKEVKIPKKSSVKTKVEIKMPDKKYQGIIAGGIYVYEKENVKEAKNAGSVNNKFVYSLGVQLRNDATIKEIKPKIELEKKKIISVREDYLNGLEINLQNVTPIFIRELQVEAKIVDPSGNSLSHEIKKDQMKMSPNSNFYFPLTWTDAEGPNLDTGSYLLEVKAASKESGEKWEWKIPLTIDSKKRSEEKETKKEIKPSVKKSNTLLWGCLAIIVSALLITSAVIIKVKKINLMRIFKK